MRTLILVSTAAVVIAATAYASPKTELDSQVKSALNKCQVEIKGCKELTDAAAGVLVFPEITKGGLGIAYETGKGALIEDGKTVGYYQTSGTSLGATVGVGNKSVAIVLRTPEEVAKFKQSSGWEVGADAGVAMLDTGATGKVDTSSIKESVVGIVFGESGVLADVSIKGSKISALEAKDLE